MLTSTFDVINGIRFIHKMEQFHKDIRQMMMYLQLSLYITMRNELHEQTMRRVA